MRYNPKQSQMVITGTTDLIEVFNLLVQNSFKDGQLISLQKSKLVDEKYSIVANSGFPDEEIFDLYVDKNGGGAFSGDYEKVHQGPAILILSGNTGAGPSLGPLEVSLMRVLFHFGGYVYIDHGDICIRHHDARDAGGSSVFFESVRQEVAPKEQENG